MNPPLFLAVLLASTVSSLPLQQQQQQPSVQWGYDMHRLGAEIAESRLGSNARNVVEDLLNGRSMAEASTWADEVRSARPWSSPLHYVNTDDYSCSLDSDAKYCVNDMCVYGAIANYTDQLVTNSRQYNQSEALMFLIHFVGDIHNPMHAAFASDLGGNDFDVRFYSSNTNLHSLWDSGLSNRRIDELGDMDDLESEVQSKMQTIWSNLVPLWESCNIGCERDMAEESAYDACEYGYQDLEPGDSLGDSYYEPNIDIFEMKLAQYAVRLAAILNQIWP